VREWTAEKGTIVLSRATNSARDDILAMFEMAEVGAGWPARPDLSDIDEFSSFEWQHEAEASAQNRSAYMDHLKKHLSLLPKYVLADAQSDRSMLTVKLRKGIKRKKLAERLVL